MPPLSDTGTGSSTTNSNTVLVQTGVLIVLRTVCFVCCQRYVKKILFLDLRQAVREDSIPLSSLSKGVGAGDGTGTRDRDKGRSLGVISVSDTENSSDLNSPLDGPSGSGSGLGSGLGASSSSTSRPMAKSWVWLKPNSSKSSAASLLPTSRLESSRPVRVDGGGGGSAVYSKLAATLFCLAFSESAVLFSLILLGSWLDARSRWLNWDISLGALLAIIVCLIPLSLCLLLTHRTKSYSLFSARTLLFTAIPFSFYLFLFYYSGNFISATVTEGAHSFDLYNSTLARICIPGVILIAALSGGGAVNTAWEAFESRQRFKGEPVTDAHLVSAERALFRARMDLEAREAEVEEAMRQQAKSETGKSTTLLGRLWNSNPAASRLASLSQELAGLRAMEAQMVKDVQMMRKRKASIEMSKTLRGKTWGLFGRAFSVYCIARVLMSCVNLVFGYTRKTGATTDVATALIANTAQTFGIEIDVARWSSLVGLLLVGSIIAVNMRSVLVWASKALKATSASVSASFMLLCLGELMAIYLLTSLISLPTPSPDSPSNSESAETAATLLSTLPDFNVFSRLFDLVFLVSAGGCFVVRWVERKVRSEDAGMGMGSQFASSGGFA